MNFTRQTDSGYIYDGRIWWSYFIILLICIVSVMASNRFDFALHPYAVCEQPVCNNPFYMMPECKEQLRILWVIPLYTSPDCRASCDWCNQTTLQKGVYGEKPKAAWLLNNLWFISIIGMMGCFWVNHILHNRGKKFDIELVVTKNKRISLVKWIKKLEDKSDDESKT